MLIFIININFFLVIKLKDRECVICHKIYTPKVWNQKVCSDICRKKYQKKMQPVWNQRYLDSHPTFRRDYYLKNKEKRDKYQKEWRDKNKTHLKEYRQQRKEKEINDVFNEYYDYLQTID